MSGWSERLFVEKQLLSDVTLRFNNKTGDQPQLLNMTHQTLLLTQFSKPVKQELSMPKQASALSLSLSPTRAE